MCIKLGYMRKKINKRNIIFDSILLVVLLISAGLFLFGLLGHIVYLPAATGVVIIISLIVMSVDILIRKNRLGIFDWVSIIFYYITALIFICAYLASVENDNLREVLVAVVSAFIGGLLTLMGVGITIKYSRIEKEEEEIKKCKPRVFPISPATWQITDKKTTSQVLTNDWITNLSKAKSQGKRYSIGIIYLATSDLSMCVYDGIMIDDEELWFDFGVVLQKNHNYALIHNISFKYKAKPKAIYLLLTDMLDNTYKARMTFDIEKNGDENVIKITSILSTKMYIKDNCIRDI